MVDYYELEEQVTSKQSFLRFLQAFIEDHHDMERKEEASPSPGYGPSANDWENPTLGRFLEAMHVWASSSYTDTEEEHVPEELSWRTLARWLSAAKVYE